MEFEITCPVDGAITVSLEDIETVVIRDSERADITFTCPDCGTEITVSAIVPSFLLAAIEALAEDIGSSDSPFAGLVSSARGHEEPVPLADWAAADKVTDAYCEYFHRQLSHIDCVADMLAEIDAKL